ncbi:MAG TPA: cupin domain-containing protein [Segetibacter sp.]
MKEVEEFIQSGILEAYVMGLATPEEVLEVEAMIAKYSEVKAAIDHFADKLERTALDNAIAPDETIKPFLMATVNYTDRLASGETPSFPPILSEESKIQDYERWLSRADMVLPAENEGVFARIIGYTPEVITAIVWLKDYAPAEVHHNEYERFLIVEGSCDIFIGDEMHQLSPGDYLQIPLFADHRVVITSSIPCKVILQRVAA